MTAAKPYLGAAAYTYDDRHYGGLSGQYVLKKDVAALALLLGAPEGLILDVPSGTGQYSALAGAGCRMVAADLSGDMVQLALKHPYVGGVLCDIAVLPFADATFAGLITIRLLQHIPKQDAVRILREERRVLKPGGRLVFDTFRWTPRRFAWLPRRLLGSGRSGEMVVYTQQEVRDMASRAGLRVTASTSLYLFSPVIYRKLPLPIVRILNALERFTPQTWFLRTFWACEKE